MSETKVPVLAGQPARWDADSVNVPYACQWDKWSKRVFHKHGRATNIASSCDAGGLTFVWCGNITPRINGQQRCLCMFCQTSGFTLELESQRTTCVKPTCHPLLVWPRVDLEWFRRTVRWGRLSVSSFPCHACWGQLHTRPRSTLLDYEPRGLGLWIREKS